MKDYSTLKREIQTYIRTNNNQEITGEVLQNVLVSIVSNVGENAGFGGIAKKTTSPGTPDGPVFYFATEQGVYPNFGGLEIERENTLNIIYNTEDGWDTLFLGNLVPNEEVEDFRTFKNLEEMDFEDASEYCATFDNIMEKLDGGGVRFSKPVIFTFSGTGSSQGMIINLPNPPSFFTQYAFTKANVNFGFTYRIIQYDLASLTITNVGEWKPISSLIPAATTSAAGLMSADDKKALDGVKGAITDFIQEDGLGDITGYHFKLAHRKANGGSGFTQVLIPAANADSPNGTGVMTALQAVDLAHSIKSLSTTFPGDGTVKIIGTKTKSSLPASEATIPLAKSTASTDVVTPNPGIMSTTDKEVLGNTGDINVGSLGNNGIDTYTTRGTYRVHGERTNANDGLPILNSNPGHTVEGILKVLDSSISGSGQDTDKVVTQVLTMSNRTGGDGHIWVRTGQGSSKSNLNWSTWEKLQGIFEKNNVTTLEDLDGYTTNGMYSGIYAGTEPKNFYTVQFLPLDTFLMITINGYAVSKLAVPQITQLLYKLPAKTSTSKQNAEIYLRTGSYNKTDKVWDWGTFTKMVTNADLSFQVETLTAKNAEQDERLGRIENTVAYLGIAGRYWDENNATSTAQGYYGSLQALRDLPKRLGLGRYLVTDDRKRKKLNPTDSTKYLDGTPAALDGSEGQCMWCWNGFYANIWHEGSRLIKAVTFDKPLGGETSVWIPAGGISWLGAGVMDRTNNVLCSVISDSEQFRGGAGVALNASYHPKAPAADNPQITMLGMPATNISATDFGNYARKRGEGWEANWFVARFVVEFLFEVIMGTENSQEAFNANRDANGLYQGGFGDGVTGMSNWVDYNGEHPLIPTSVGLEAGDGVCLVEYKLPQTNGVDGDTYKAFNVPVFFGLVGAGYGNLYQFVRGLIIDVGEEQSPVYVTPSMYADYDPNTVADKILVAECPRVSGFIKRKSYRGLCCIPTELGGSPTIHYSDYLYVRDATLNTLNTRSAGFYAYVKEYSGISCTFLTIGSGYNFFTLPLCYFTDDPIIPDSQSIENNN